MSLAAAALVAPAGTLGGTVGDGTGIVTSVVKTGAGTWNLTNAGNTFTGGVSINQGALGVPAIGPAGSAGPLGTAGTIT